MPLAYTAGTTLSDDLVGNLASCEDFCKDYETAFSVPCTGVYFNQYTGLTSDCWLFTDFPVTADYLSLSSPGGDTEFFALRTSDATLCPPAHDCSSYAGCGTCANTDGCSWDSSAVQCVSGSSGIVDYNSCGTCDYNDCSACTVGSNCNWVPDNGVTDRCQINGRLLLSDGEADSANNASTTSPAGFSIVSDGVVGGRALQTVITSPAQCPALPKSVCPEVHRKPLSFAVGTADCTVLDIELVTVRA